jgi:alkyl sulfatase BDS1-like metallo-beta-lactamase superfamily hydrolase
MVGVKSKFLTGILLAGALHAQAVDLTVPPSIRPELRDHTNLFEKKIYPIGGNVYCAVGFGLANIILIEGSDGTILIDTGISVEQGKAVAAEFAKITRKPLVAIVYTHHHADHVQGTLAFTSADNIQSGADDVRSGKVAIYAHESLLKEYTQESLVAGEIMTQRAGAMYNSLLTGKDREGVNSGIGPIIQSGTNGFLPPTKTFADSLSVTIAGVDLRMVYVPSEANSEIAVFLPQNKVLLSAEVVQDHTFPNIYTLRGVVYRDPMQWVRSLDRLREFPADFMVLQHGPPVSGKAEVAEVLRNYRDAIQFVRDQTIRFMNQGLAPDEIADIVKLPPHLANFHPWLTEFYGTVRHSIPNIYQGNVGWFEGDPVTLQPTPRVEYARRLIGLMGGRDKVLAEARKSFAAGDPQFAAELATYLIRVDNDDKDARLVKAASFRKLGYATLNANWHGFYLTLANALDGSLVMGRGRGGLNTGLPTASLMETLAPRLKAERTLDLEESYGLQFTDTGEAFTVQIRRGVVVVSPGLSQGLYATLSGTKAVLGTALSGSPAAAITVQGPTGAAGRFASYFEVPNSHPVTYFLR